MCLIELTKQVKHDILAKLPDMFPCWKVIQKNGHCYYDPYRTQPKLTRRTHIAQDFPDHRRTAHYPPSFHAYLKMPVLKPHNESWYRIVKCWAKKEDINCIGHPRDFYISILTVAVSKITRK